MLEIKDINKVKILMMSDNHIKFKYEDTIITLDDFKGTCTVVTMQENDSEEKKYQIVECEIENFINKLTSLATAKKFKSEIIDIERKILNLTREKELKKIALHVLEDVLEENSLVM